MRKGEALTELKKEITNILMKKTKKEWQEIFDKYDCCIEIIPNAEGISKNDKQLRFRDLDVSIEVTDTKTGKKEQIIVPKTPLRMSDGMNLQTKSGPKLGEHNQQLMSRL